MKRKRFSAFLLALLFAAQSIPVFASEAEPASETVSAEEITEEVFEEETAVTSEAYTDGDYTYTVSGGNATITGYAGSGGNLTIPTSLGGYTVTGVGSYAFKNCTSLTSLVIPSNVKKIDYEAFRGCKGLTSLTLNGNGMTMGGYAFAYCSNLKTVTLNGIFSNIGYNAFMDCTNLETVTIAGTVGTIDSHAFDGCGNLVSIDLPEGLTAIDGSAFLDCTSLRKVVFPDTLKTIGDYAFKNCKALTSLIIPSNVTKIGYESFRGCTGLTAVTLNGNSMAIGGYAFAYCSNMKTATLNGTFDNIGHNAFMDCTNLETVTIAGTVGTIDSHAFDGCGNLVSINLPEGLTVIDSSAFLDCSSLKSITLPTTLKTIGDYAFKKCTSLTRMIIPSNVTKIGYESFRGCTGLTAVTLNGNSMAIGGYAFAYCSNMKTATLNGTFDNIGHNAFMDCTNLETVTIAGTVGTIDSHAFDGCGNLVSIDLPEGLTVIDSSAFLDCTSLGKVVFPDTLKTIGDYAFKNCKALTSLTVPNSVTFIGYETFRGCTGLTDVVLSSALTRIGSYAFYNCTSLSAAYFNGNVPTTWGTKVFYNNTADFIIHYPYGNTSGWETPQWKADDGTIYNTQTFTPVEEETGDENASTIVTSSFPTSDISLAEGSSFHFKGSVSTTSDAGLSSVQVKITNAETGTNMIYYSESNIGTRRFMLSAIPEFTVGEAVSGAGLGSIKPTLGTSWYVEIIAVDNEGGMLSGTRRLLEVVSKELEKQDSEIVEPEQMKITVLDRITGNAVSGAKVTLGSKSAVTSYNGTVTLAMPDTNSAMLDISLTGYNFYRINDYSGYLNSSSDTIEILQKGVTEVLPKTCNDVNINTGAAQINNKADLTAKIVIEGAAAEEITRYQLKQGELVLGESTDGIFNIHNSKFQKNVPVTAVMVLSSGKTVQKNLNIRVISFSIVPSVLPFSKTSLQVPADVTLFGGLEIELGTDDIKVTTAVSNDELKIGWNANAINKELSILNKDLRKWMNSNRRKSSTEFNLAVGGYMVVKVGNEGIKSTHGELVFIANYKNGFGKTYFIPLTVVTVPVRLEVEFSLEGEMTVKLAGFDLEEEKVIFPALDAAFKGSLTARGGVGFSLASAGVYGTVGLALELNLLPKFMADKLVASGEFGVYAKAKVGFLNYEAKAPILTGNLVLYDSSRADLSETSLTAYSEENLYSASEYDINDRAYLALQSGWDSDAADGVLQSSVYDNADPQIVTAGDTTLLMYLRDNGGSDAYNFQELVYSVWTGTGWSAPVPVDDNDLVDADFTLYTDGSDIRVVYCEANRSFTSADEAADYVGAMEITAAKYDISSGKFADYTVLTDNSTYDLQPVITVTNNIPVVVWSNNADNNLFGMTANNTIYMSILVNGVWSTQTAASNVPAVVSLAAGSFEAGVVTIAAVLDGDSDYSTTDDRTVKLYDTNGNTASFASGENENLVFTGNTLYWYSGGSIVKIDSLDGTAETAVEGLSADSSPDFRVAEEGKQTAILYRVYNTEGENGGSDIYAVIYDGEGWGLPVRVTVTEGYVDSFDAVFNKNGDGLTAVYRRTDVSFTEDSFDTVSELCSKNITFGTGLTVLDTSYDYDDLMDGGDLAVTVTVKNSGTLDVSGITVTIGTFSKTVDTEIISGGTAEIELLYPLPDDLPEEVVIEAVPADESVISLADSTDGVIANEGNVLRLGYVDFAVHGEAKIIGGEAYIGATVKNVGNIAGEGIVNFRKGDETGAILYNETINLEPGESRWILLKLLNTDLETVYIEIESEAEEYITADNTDAVTAAYASKADLYDVNGDGLVNMADAAEMSQKLTSGGKLGEEYDFDGDGTVDKNDAVYFAWSFVKPGEYPIG